MTQPLGSHTNEPEIRGIRCSKCGCFHFRLIYTRRVLLGRLIRRRECRHCGRRIMTAETIRG